MQYYDVWLKPANLPPLPSELRLYAFFQQQQINAEEKKKAIKKLKPSNTAAGN